MFMLKNTKITLIAHIFLVATLAIAFVLPVAAAIPAGCPGGPAGAPSPGTVCSPQTPAPAGSTSVNNSQCESQDLEPNDDCLILKYLLGAINVLSALVGIVIVIMIAVGGLQYSASRDNPQATQAAKEKIRNAILALLAYMFMYAFLQYIIPGGVL